jgi:hypothetical protein
MSATDAGQTCRQFWRYTGAGGDPDQIALECARHGVIPGATAADPERHVAEVWAEHLRGVQR